MPFILCTDSISARTVSKAAESLAQKEFMLNEVSIAVIADGVGFIDITVPSEPAYAFAFLGENKSENATGDEPDEDDDSDDPDDDIDGVRIRGKPLSASEYLWTYFKKPLDVSEGEHPYRFQRTLVTDTVCNVSMASRRIRPT